VEDDRAVREAISEALVDAGYAVAKATDGADAWAQVREHPPDAILLDLMMPVMDGWDLLDTLQHDADLASIPVGIISGSPSTERTARACGVLVALSKPFALDHLLGQVECLLDEPAIRDREIERSLWT
jgi:CheY-like chemotaxis protein